MTALIEGILNQNLRTGDITGIVYRIAWSDCTGAQSGAQVKAYNSTDGIMGLSLNYRDSYYSKRESPCIEP
jgi:hypothetical protein